MHEQTMAEARTMTLQEVGLLVKILRDTNGWTQETLAEISGLTTRTIQRVENGDSASAETRRALARAFKIEDLDTFNKPYEFKSEEDLKREAEELKRNFLTLDVTIAEKGAQLADLAETCGIWSFNLQGGVEINDEVDEAAAELFDYLQEYGDCSELYTFSQKRGVHAGLCALVERVKAARYSVCVARRDTKLTSDGLKDNRPWAVSIGYVFIALAGKEPKTVAVPKAVQFG